MEQEKKKKNKLLLPVIIAASVLVLGGTAGVLALSGAFKGNVPQESTESETEEPVTEPEEDYYTGPLYWNIDRDLYDGKAVTGGSSRGVSKNDGYYHILFAADGRQMTRRCAEKKLVDRIDMNDLMGLEFDDKGVIVKVIGLNDIIKGYDIQGLYVQEVKEDGTLIMNSAKGLNGRTFEYTLPEGVKIYDMCGRGTAAFVGQEMTKSKLLAGDRLFVFINKNDTITTAMVTERQVKVDLYWNVNRQWNSELLATKREPNADGEYEILMACNGEQVVVKTKDRNIASSIDRISNYTMGLEFDSAGYVCKVRTAAAATGGTTQAGWSHILEATESSFVSKKLITAGDTGKVWELKMAKNYDIFDVSGKSDFIGQRFDKFEVGYQIFCVCNAQMEVETMFIINRITDDPVYWNVERKYDSTKKQTTRTPDKEGYYHFLMAADGKQVELRTNDITIANKIDSNASKNTGLKLDGDIIVGVYSSVSTRKAGGSTTASWADVTSMKSSKEFHTLKDPDSGVAKAGEQLDLTMIDDVEIYNVSSNYNSFVGEKTTLKVGDRVHCLTNVNGEVAIIFVVSRPITYPIYWNVQRKYNYTTKQTTREVQGDGYYHLLMAVNGKQVELRTKDKKIVQSIDSNSSCCNALKVSGDIILKVYSASDTTATKGGTTASWADITAIYSATKFHTLKDPNSGVAKAGEQLDLTMASNCKVYNCSSQGYQNFIGEEATIQVGDRVHCFKNSSGKVSYIFIVDRKVPDVEKLCPECGQVVTWKAYNGSFTYDTQNATHFYFYRGRTPNGQMGTTDAGIIHLDLNGKTLNCADDCRAFQVANNSYVTIMDLSDEKTAKVVANGGYVKSGSAQGGTLFYLPYTNSSLKLLNVTVDGSGAVNEEGRGLFYVATDAKLVLENCTITAGTVGEGSAIYSKGQVTLKNTTIKDGVAVTGGAVVLTTAGKLTLEGTSSVTGNTLKGGQAANIILPEGVLIQKGASGITGGTYGVTTTTNGVFTGEEFDTLLSNFQSDYEVGTISAEGTALKVEYAITGIAFENENITVKRGDFEQLVVKTLPVNIAGQKVTYEVSDPTIVKVYDDGRILGLQASETPVTVTAKTEDELYSATMQVTVEEADATAHLHAENTVAKIHTGEEITYKPWPKNDALPTDSGYYYLTEDVHFSAKQPIMAANQELHICLNGFTIDNAYEGNAQTISMFNQGCSLSICDCSEGQSGKITANGTYDVPGRVIWVRYGTLNIYGGTYVGAETNNSQGGGAICVSKGATLNMFGGKIQGGTAVLKGTAGGLGGALSVLGTANLSDVVIENGTAVQGGNIYVSGTLNILSNVTVQNGTATAGRGGNLFCDTSAVVTAKGATFKGGSSTEVGGNLYTKGTTFTMEDSTIDGGTTTQTGKAGGNIHIAGGANTFKNVVFKNGEGTNANGTAVHMNTASGTLTLENVEIQGTMLVQGAKSITLKGETKIGATTGGLNLSNATATYLQAVTADSLTTGAKIYISANKAGVIVLGGKAYKDAFASTIADLELKENGDDLELAVPAEKHEHCVCGGTITTGTELGGDVTHTCAKKEWTAWEEDSTLPTYDDMVVGDNYFYLTKDVTLTANWKPGTNGSKVETDMGGRKLYLCLNGHNVTASGIGILLSISGQANFDITLTDCAKTAGKLSMGTKDKSNGTNPLFWLNSKGTLNIYNITVDGNGLQVQKAGALIGTASGVTVNLFSGTLMNAKTVKKDSSTYNGGLIHVVKDAAFNMYGGTLKDGVASGMGGNLSNAYGGVSNIYAGSIENGSAFQGGNIYASGSFTMKGEVTVKNGTATERGANMWTDSSGVINITGVTFDGGTAQKVGGSIYGKSLVMNFTNVKVKDARSGDAGGAFSFANSTKESTITLTNVEVTGCTSKNSYANAIHLNAGTVNLVLKNCTMDNSIYLQNAKSVTVSGLTKIGTAPAGSGKAGLVLALSAITFGDLTAGSEIFISATASGATKTLKNAAKYSTEEFLKAYDGGTFTISGSDLTYKK